ncbi:carboxymuconolactone decarboxylase family protein, partial [Streptomyces sp. NPDC007914]
MEARLNLFENPLAGKVIRYVNSAGKAVSDSTLPHAT